MKTGFPFPRGSEWRKCDLHFHTPSSYDYKNKSVSNQEIINTLVANEIGLVAITDHHVIDVQRIKELQRLATGRITVLPGIEIHSELGGSESVHFIGIFPEDWDVDANWIKIQAGCKLTPDVISEKGDQSIYCDLKEACHLFHELGGIVSVHAGAKSNTIENITNALSHKMALKTDLVTDYIDVFEIGKVADIEDYRAKVFPVILRDIPMVICSDNHDIKNYVLRENCWIKCDPTFSGLRQILFEPSHRVSVRHSKPEPKVDYQVIDKVRFLDKRSNPDFSSDLTVLNPNMCCVIGGKSAGKSMLLYVIARTIDPAQVSDRMKGLPLPEYWFCDAPDFDFEVHWKDGVIMTLKDLSSFKRPITYIPQLYINKLAEQQGEQSFYDLTLETLRQNPEFDKFYAATMEKIKGVRSDVSKNVIALFKLKDDLKDRLSALQKLGDSDGILREIESIEKQIEEMKNKSGFTTDEAKKYQEVLAESQVSEKEKARLSIIVEELEAYRTLLRNMPDELDYSLEMQTLEFKQKVGEDSEAVELIDSIEKSVKSEIADAFRTIADRNFTSIAEYRRLLDVTESALSVLKNELQPYLEKFQNQAHLSELQNSLFQQKELREEIEKKDRILSTTQEKIKLTKKALVASYTNLVDLYSEIKGKLEEEQFKRIEDIELKASMVFDVDKFNDQLGGFFDKRHDLSGKLSGFDIHNKYVYDAGKHVPNIIALLDTILDESQSVALLRSEANHSTAVLKLLEDYFAIRLDLLHNGDPLLQMSPGKRGIVLLKLYLHLSNSSSPILIDQPEDNLDNRTIFTELMEFIKSRKSRRQIVMISHNANLVVAGDAEQVIVCNQDGQRPGRENRQFRFEYVSGALENRFMDVNAKGVLFQKGIRDHVCEILEGGEDAFKARENKYGIV